MRELIFALSCLLLACDRASAGGTLLYFRIADGVRYLSTTAPESSENGTCAGVDSSGNQGCDVITANIPDGQCLAGRRYDASTPMSTYSFVVPEYWGWDNALVDTGFRYHAALSASGLQTFTQPKIKVTYKYSDQGPSSWSYERMGTPCACTLKAPSWPAGCDLHTKGTFTTFDKDGGNMDNGPGPNPSLLDHLQAGSTVLVEVWNAEGQGNADFLSSTGYQSYIYIPYSKDNYKITGEVSPQWVKSGSKSVAISYKLSIVQGATQADTIEIDIPGGSSLGSAQYFDVPGKSDVTPGATGTVTTFNNATSSANGLIVITYDPPLGKGDIETVSINCNVPSGHFTDVQWSARAKKSGGGTFLPTQAFTDSFYMAVLDDPAAPTGLGVIPIYTDSGGQWLKLS